MITGFFYHNLNFLFCWSTYNYIECKWY